MEISNTTNTPPNPLTPHTELYRSCDPKTAIDLFLLVNIVSFFGGRSLAGGRKIPLTASLTLAVKFVSLFF